MASTDEKQAKVKRPRRPAACDDETPRSPDADKIIKRLVKRHRGVLERLAKL